MECLQGAVVKILAHDKETKRTVARIQTDKPENTVTLCCRDVALCEGDKVTAEGEWYEYRVRGQSMFAFEADVVSVPEMEIQPCQRAGFLPV